MNTYNDFVEAMNNGTLSMDERRNARRAVFASSKAEIDARIETTRARIEAHKEEHAKRMQYFKNNNAEKALYDSN